MEEVVYEDSDRGKRTGQVTAGLRQGGKKPGVLQAGTEGREWSARGGNSGHYWPVPGQSLPEPHFPPLDERAELDDL